MFLAGRQVMNGKVVISYFYKNTKVITNNDLCAKYLGTINRGLLLIAGVLFQVRIGNELCRRNGVQQVFWIVCCLERPVGQE